MADDRVPSPEEFFGGKPAVRGEDAPKEGLEFENALGVGASHEVLDIFEPDDEEGPALRDDLHQHFGGEEGFEAAAVKLREAAAVLDPENEILSEIMGISRGEENDLVKTMVSAWDEILSDPAKATVMLQKIDADTRAGKEPWRTYWRGGASEELKNAVVKLWQAAHGEPVVGRQIPRTGEQVIVSAATSSRK